MTQQLLEDIDYTQIVTEDDTPVDNFQSEKQQRLLVEPLYSSWQPGISFIAAANVGLFYALKQDALVPDAFLTAEPSETRCVILPSLPTTVLTRSNSVAILL